MAYIGKSPSVGVRDRYYYTSVGGETSISGADDDSRTLTFTDGKYVDVMLNGITLVAGTDYVTTTANTISALDSLGDSDVVEVVVYDVFAIADTVSSTRGGTFEGPVVFNGNLTVNGSFIPSTDSAYDLGDSAIGWKDGYYTGTVTAARLVGDGSGITNLVNDLDGLTDVSVGTPTDGQVLTYKDSSGLFEFDSAASSMAALSDVDLTGVQDGHTIIYDAASGQFQADSISSGSNITPNVLWENASLISTAYSITSGNNALSAGPITVDSGGSVTVPSGSRWVVV